MTPLIAVQKLLNEEAIHSEISLSNHWMGRLMSQLVTVPSVTRIRSVALLFLASKEACFASL